MKKILQQIVILQVIEALFLPCFGNLAFAALCPKTMTVLTNHDTGVELGSEDCNKVCGNACIEPQTMKCGTYDYIKGEDIIFPCDMNSYCPDGNYACNPEGNCIVPETCALTGAGTGYTCALTGETFVGEVECTAGCAHDYYSCKYPGHVQNPAHPTEPYDGKKYSAYIENTGSNPSSWTFNSTYDPYVECKNNCEKPNGCVPKTETKAQFTCVYNGIVYDTLNSCSSNCFSSPTGAAWECTDPTVTNLFETKELCVAGCSIPPYECKEHVFQQLFTCNNPAVKGIFPAKEQCEANCYGNRFMCYSNQKNYDNVDDCRIQCKSECVKQGADATYTGYLCKSTNTPYANYGSEVLDSAACQAGCPTIGSGGSCRKKTTMKDNMKCASNGFTSTLAAFCQANCFEYQCVINGVPNGVVNTDKAACVAACIDTNKTFGFCSRQSATTGVIGENGYRCTFTGAKPCNRNPASGDYVSYICGIGGHESRGAGVRQDYDNCQAGCSPAPGAMNAIDYGSTPAGKAACEAACVENLVDSYKCSDSGTASDGKYFPNQQDCQDSCKRCPTGMSLSQMVTNASPYWAGGTLMYGCSTGGNRQCLTAGPNDLDTRATPKYIDGPGSMISDNQWQTYSATHWDLQGAYLNPVSCIIPIHVESCFVNQGPFNNGDTPCDCASSWSGKAVDCCSDYGNCAGLSQNIDVSEHGVCTHIPVVTIPHSCSNEMYAGYQCAVDESVVENTNAIATPHLSVFNTIGNEQGDLDACNLRCSSFLKGNCDNGHQGPPCVADGQVEMYEGWECVTYEGVTGTVNTGPSNSDADQVSCEINCEQALSDCTKAISSEKCIPLDMSKM